MDGIFYKGSLRVYNIIGLIAGVFLILFFGFILCAEPYDAGEDLFGSIFFMCFGALVAVFCGISLYVDHKAFIHADDSRVKAFCHFGLSLSCEISEIESVSYTGMELTLKLKTGRRYSLIYMKNAYDVGRYIRRRLPRKTEKTQSKETLLAETMRLTQMWKQCGSALILSFVLWFAGIILTVWMTDWKDMSEFTRNDWVIFAAMTGICLIVMIVIVLLTRKTARLNVLLNEKRRLLARAILFGTPLRSGNVVAVFVDDVDDIGLRMTVYGYPNAEDVYYIVEQADRHGQLVCTHESHIYSNFSELAPELEGLERIPADAFGFDSVNT